MKIIISMFLIVIMVSCNNSKKEEPVRLDSKNSVLNKSESIQEEGQSVRMNNSGLELDLKENLSIEDLLELEKYKTLKIDSDFQKYIKEYWEANLAYYLAESIAFLDLSSELNIIDEKINIKTDENDPMGSFDKLKGLVKTAGKGVKAAYNVTGEAYKIIKLENEREKLFSGFSKDKEKLASDFEKEIDRIIKYSTVFLKNDKVKESDILLNYKSIRESLKSDRKVKKELDKLCKMMDKFYLTNAELKQVLVFNKLIKGTDSSSIVEYGNILLDGDIEKIKVKPRFLKKYFTEVKDILDVVDNSHFDIPIEDWSEEKKENIEFIYDDIKTRLFVEINSLGNY